MTEIFENTAEAYNIRTNVQTFYIYFHLIAFDNQHQFTH